MECTKNLDTKYQNLAAEYSKLRANATVLKKAVLDEQARSRELKEHLKDHEQKLRKSDQEMESLTFRNLQLTKRISVLQEELDVKSVGRRAKGKFTSTDNSQPAIKGNVTLLDEELQKKIMDNAQLISAMTDKDLEISNLREILTELEEKLLEEQKQKEINKQRHIENLQEIYDNHKKEISELTHPVEQKIVVDHQCHCTEMEALEKQVEHWRKEYELLLESGGGNNKYLYARIDALMGERQEAEGRASSITAECSALQVRLELALSEKTQAEVALAEDATLRQRLQEELTTTTHNYEQQLSTMSEHLADLNDKYTEQSEILQQLQFQLHNNSVGSRKSK